MEEENKVIQAENKRISDAYRNAMDAFVEEKISLTMRLGNAKTELSNLGIYKKNRKEELRQAIISMKIKMGSLKAPMMDDFGAIKPLNTIDHLELLLPPEDSDEPIYPEKPVKSEMPAGPQIQEMENKSFSILCDTFEKHDMDTSEMRKVDTRFFGKLPGGKLIEWIRLDKKDGFELYITRRVIGIR